MRLFYYFMSMSVAIDINEFRENKAQANAILSRKPRGIKKTIGKVAAVGGTVYAGKKLAGKTKLEIDFGGEGKYFHMIFQ